MSVLYLDHFNLSADPFRITPDTAFFFTGGQRGDFLEGLVVASMHDEGIVSVVGEIGMGKTMLTRMLLERLRLLPCDTVYLANPVFDRNEILEAITRDLMHAPERGNRAQTLAILESALLERYTRGRRVVVVIDEAHSMPAPTLEEIRLLSNLETSHHKLLKIVLFGQPELDELLNSTRLRQVKDRISHRFELQPFTAQEACSYLTFRLQKAGWQGEDLFDAAAHKLLLQASGGRTRKLNMLADKSMLAAYAEGATRIGLEQVRRAVGDDTPNAKRDVQVTTAVVDKPARRLNLPRIALVALGLLATLSVGYGLGAGYGTRWDQRLPALRTPPAPAVSQPQTPAASAEPASSIAKPANQATEAGPSPAAQVQASAVSEALPTASKAGTTATAVSLVAAVAPLLMVQLRDPSMAVRMRATNAFIASPDNNGFTLQVLSQRAPSEPDVLVVAKKIQLALDDAAAQAGLAQSEILILVHDRFYQKQLFHALYVGHFESRQAALKFIESSLPALKGFKPVVRSLEAIRKEPAP
jgi:MSHA biogenesis protein MshM